MTLRFLAAGLVVALLASPAVLAQTRSGEFMVAAADAAQGQKTQQTAAAGDASSLLADTRPVESLDDKTLGEKFRTARELMKGGSLSKADQQKLRPVLRAVRDELMKRKKAGGQNQ